MLLLLRLRGGGDNVVVRPEVVSVEFWLDLWQLRYSLHFYCHLSSVSDWHVTVEREVNSASVWAGLFPRCAVAVARERLASWTPPPPQHCTVANLEGSHAPDSLLSVTMWRKTFKLIFSLLTISVNILTISSPLSSQWEFAHEISDWVLRTCCTVFPALITPSHTTTSTTWRAGPDLGLGHQPVSNSQRKHLNL